MDQLQSEQGARFLKKRNRNIIVLIDKKPLPVNDNFIWLTIGDLKSLMNFDNIVNMDTRTVISGIDYGFFNDDIKKFSKKHQINIQNPFIVSTLSEVITFRF